MKIFNKLIFQSFISNTQKINIGLYNIFPKFSLANQTLETKYLLKNALEQCSDKLKRENIEDPDLEAEYIISAAIGIERDKLNTKVNKKMDETVIKKIDQMTECRLARMPIQYIIKNWEFHSIPIRLEPPVFIPRPETEQLVNIALHHLETITNPLVLDLGCGSGAISLALLHNNKKLQCVAVDHSQYATNLTLKNAKNIKLEERLFVIREKISREGFSELPFNKYDVIISNPPYVLKKDLMTLQPEILLYEDLRALDGGIDGLDVIKNIILNGCHRLKDKGIFLIEIDPCHEYLIPEWMKSQNTGLCVDRFYHDYRGKCRFIQMSKYVG